MSVVIHSSVTLAWIYSDELTAPVQQVLERVIASRAWVPSIWRLEVGNSLETAVRLAASMSLSEARPWAISPYRLSAPIKIPIRSLGPIRSLWRIVVALRIYDAAYLELSRSLSLPIVTLDNELQTAALAEGRPSRTISGAWISVVRVYPLGECPILPIWNRRHIGLRYIFSSRKSSGRVAD